MPSAAVAVDGADDAARQHRHDGERRWQRARPPEAGPNRTPPLPLCLPALRGGTLFAPIGYVKLRRTRLGRRRTGVLLAAPVPTMGRRVNSAMYRARPGLARS